MNWPRCQSCTDIAWFCSRRSLVTGSQSSIPSPAPCCRRKKDHGRAEALVLAAWASGIELPEAAFESAQAAIDAAEGVTSVVEPLPAEEEAELLQPVPQQA